MKHSILFAAVVALSIQTAPAVPTEWTFASGGNGHFYEVVATPGGINWFDAQAQAQARGGYLATITSAAENNFVFSLASQPQFWGQVGGGTRGPWLGGLQPVGSPEPGGGWTWVTGEAFSFQNWDPAEPNNNGNEDRIHYYGTGFNHIANTWNDLGAADGTFSFVVELVPEPGTGALCGAALVIGLLRRRSLTLPPR